MNKTKCGSEILVYLYFFSIRLNTAVHIYANITSNIWGTPHSPG